MQEERKENAYVQKMRQDFTNLAMGHGASEQGADELADFLIDKTNFSFQNGMKYASKKHAIEA